MRYIWFVILFLCPLLGQAQEKKIGDVIENPDGSKGVVFWLNPDGTGGWMVALKDLPPTGNVGGWRWGYMKVDIPDLPNTGSTGYPTINKVLLDTAGHGNTKKIRAVQGSGSVFAVQAIDFDHGWYLPSLGQLRRLFATLSAITPVLVANGGEKLRNTGMDLQNYAYYSSTEGTADVAWVCLFSNGQVGTVEKSTRIQVRAVRSFSYARANYDPNLSYRWKSGQKTPMITDVPRSSMEYAVTVETSVGCKNTATKQVFVAKGKDTTIYDVICKGETYRKHGFQVSTAGTYTRKLTGAERCEFNLTLVLSVNEPRRTEFHDTICEGDIYTRHNFAVWKAGDYTQAWTSAEGCDSTVVLHLAVSPRKERFIYASVCKGETYAENGFHVSKAGSYSRKLQSVAGCDSVVNLVLKENPVYDDTVRAAILSGETYTGNGFSESASGTYSHIAKSVAGCDSLMTLVLTVKPENDDTIRASICEGNIYDANGFRESKTGTYVQYLKNEAGRDSVVTLILLVNPVYDHTFRASICQGEVYEANGFHVSEAGTYTRNLQSVSGCDSIVRLVLAVNPVYADTIRASLCEGEVYAANGFRESAAGIYTHRYLSVSGCDSTVTLVLTVNPAYRRSLSVSLCEGEAYDANGFHESATGVYTRNLQSVSGCDSILVLILTINPLYNQTIPASICQGETYVGNGFDESVAGTYTRRHSSVSGCDSIVTLVLAVHPLPDDTIRASICEGEVYASNGFSQSVAGIYSRHLQSKFGCDSTVTLDLEVDPAYLFESAKDICEGESYDFFGTLLTTTGVYERALATGEGCDSVYRVALRVRTPGDTLIKAVICRGDTYRGNGFEVSAAGEYVRHLQTEAHCDSTVRLQLEVEDPFDGTMDVSLKDCKAHVYLFEAVAGDMEIPASLAWDFGDGSQEDSPKMEHRYEESGEYRVTLKIGEACGTVVDTLIKVPEYRDEIEIYANRTEIDNQHLTVRLWTDELPEMFYGWDLDDGTMLSGYEIAHLFKGEKEYYDVRLTSTNADGCPATALLRITCFWDVLPPNTFSPNGDGINDFFMKGYRLRIIDRNGLEIYKGNDGWDGTYKGRQVTEDTYFYELYVPGGQAGKVKTGYIMVIR